MNIDKEKLEEPARLDETRAGAEVKMTEKDKNKRVSKPKGADMIPAEEIKVMEIGVPKLDAVQNVTAGTIFDLIGQLKLVVHQQLRLDSFNVSIPMSEMAGRGEIALKEQKTIVPQVRIWIDTPNDQKYIISGAFSEISFSTVDEYIEKLIEDSRHEIELASTYLREPRRIDINGSLCHDPAALGIPYDEICRTTVLDDNLRNLIRSLCLPADVRRTGPGRLTLNVFEYPPRSRARSNLLSYAHHDMPLYRKRLQKIVDTSNRLRRRVNSKIRPTSQWESLLPIVPYDAVSHFFDGYNVSSNMRCEALGNTCGFNLALESVAAATLLKSAGLSTNRPSYMNDIISISYSSYMGPQIAAYITSLLAPGEMILDVNFDDIDEDNVEYRGLAALVARCMLMTDFDSTYNNVSENSLIVIDQLIARWGNDRDVLERIPGARNRYAMLNYKYRKQRANDKYKRLCVNEGRAGLNDRSLMDKREEMRTFYPSIGYRRNYCIDVDDYREFELNGSDISQWEMYEAVINFVSNFKESTTYRSFFQCALSRMVKFFVRLNEHMKVFWYTTFRNSEATQRMRNYVSSDREAMRSTINSKTLIFLSKCLNGDEIKPKTEIMERLKMESGFSRDIIEFAGEYCVAANAAARFECEAEYTQKRYMKAMNNLNASAKYIFSYLEASGESSKLTPMVLRGVLVGRFASIFMPIYERLPIELIPKGIVPGVILKYRLNNLNKKRIQDLILRKTIYENTMNEENIETLTGYDIRRYIEERSLASILYDAEKKPVMLKLPTPFRIVHSIADMGNATPLQINTDDNDASLRKRLKLSPFTFELISFDERRYTYDDDYTPKPVQLETMQLPGRYRNFIYKSLEKYLTGLHEDAISTYFICEDAYVYRSLYDV